MLEDAEVSNLEEQKRLIDHQMAQLQECPISSNKKPVSRGNNPPPPPPT